MGITGPSFQYGALQRPMISSEPRLLWLRGPSQPLFAQPYFPFPAICAKAMMANIVRCLACTIERLHLNALAPSEHWALALRNDPCCDHSWLYSTLLLSLICDHMPPGAVCSKPTFTVADVLYTAHPECGNVMRSSPKYTRTLQNLIPASMQAQGAETHTRVKALLVENWVK
ncbi:hypothetical protein JMJ35_007888 [Cladonia borealis]|uniref:Uncharacterized protein n=1 Tax=Cladonia borealis TaxID=184061 RepID=A0AA39QX07_9LECA|nr:hypothetical protein JMJ35_007888 [Cladonia borealis]